MDNNQATTGKSGHRWAMALTLVALLLLGECACTNAGDEINATIETDASNLVGTFSPNLLGHNIQWTDRADGLLVDTDGKKPQFHSGVMAAIQQLPVPVIRFPGGAMASTYIWEEGIGPLAARGTGQDFNRASQPMLFGTGEYLALLKLLGAGGMITLNLNRDPAEAAAWLTFVRHAGASVSYWEAGNESFLPQDPSYTSADNYVSKYLALRKALKAVDPNAKVGPILEGSLINTRWGSAVVPELGAWNQKIVEGTAGQAEFYATHLYAPLSQGQNDLATARSLAAAPEALGRNLAVLAALINSRSPHKELWVTEFNALTDDSLANWRFGTSLAQAGYVTSLILTMARQGVSGANYWSMLGNHNFGLIKSAADPRLRPAALAYKLLAPLSGAQAVLTRVSAPDLDYPEVGNVPAALAAKTIDAQAFLQSGKVHLVLVNRDPTTPVSVTWKMAGSQALVAGSVGQVMISGPDILADNEDTDRVRLGKVQILAPQPNQMVMLLPPGSITRVWGQLQGLQ